VIRNFRRKNEEIGKTGKVPVIELYFSARFIMNQGLLSGMEKAAGAIPETHYKALEIIIDKFKGHNIEWMVFGSANLALQGVNVEVHDIDLATDKESLEKAAELLKEYMTKPVNYREKGPFKSYNSAFKINGVDIELIYELQHKLRTGGWAETNQMPKKKIFEYKGLQIPLTPLEIEHQAYELMGRVEKARKVKEFLEKKQ